MLARHARNLRLGDALLRQTYAALRTSSVADWPKTRFNAESADKGRFVSKGLWALSGHLIN